MQYTIVSKILKCPIHYTFEDILYYPKPLLEKNSYFKPCHGHYHTVKNGINIIICSSQSCLNKHKKYLKSIDNEEFLLFCNSPYCY
ncbi:hypothetical protein Yalta_015 [Yalta virus]|nr:hypothetical protein Yalta_015 [Yalta virus]